MSAESSKQPGGWNCAWDALAEIRTCSGELQTFIWGVFDHLDGLADELLVRELDRQQLQRQGEQETLQGQINRLTSVATELADAVAEQKRLTGQKYRNGR